MGGDLCWCVFPSASLVLFVVCLLLNPHYISITDAQLLAANTWHSHVGFGKEYYYDNGCFNWVSRTNAEQKCESLKSGAVPASIPTAAHFLYFRTQLISADTVTGSVSCAYFQNSNHIGFGGGCSSSNSGSKLVDANMQWWNGDAWLGSVIVWRSNEPSHSCPSEGTLIYNYDLQNFDDANPSQYGIVCEKMLPATTTTVSPTVHPSVHPTLNPSSQPSASPTTTMNPTANPTFIPTSNPTGIPSQTPSNVPTAHPAYVPSENPSSTMYPTLVPTLNPPTQYPTAQPSSSNNDNNEGEVGDDGGGVDEDTNGHSKIKSKSSVGGGGSIADQLTMPFALLGIGIFIFMLVLVIVCLLGYLYWRRRRNTMNTQERDGVFNSNASIDIMLVSMSEIVQNVENTDTLAPPATALKTPAQAQTQTENGAAAARTQVQMQMQMQMLNNNNNRAREEMKSIDLETDTHMINGESANNHIWLPQQQQQQHMIDVDEEDEDEDEESDGMFDVADDRYPPTATATAMPTSTARGTPGTINGVTSNHESNDDADSDAQEEDAAADAQSESESDRQLYHTKVDAGTVGQTQTVG